MKENKFIDGLVVLYLKSKIIKSIYWLIINITSVLVIILLYILKPVKHIKLFMTYNESRIGHLAANTEILLRRIALNKKNKKDYIGITNYNPANKQLLRMFKREIRIIQVPNIIYKTIAAGMFNINKKSLFGKSVFYEPLPYNSNEYYEFNNAKANLSFTKAEEEKGRKLLKKMGITDKDWFVCFHARDSAYLTHNFKKDYSKHDYRDCNVKNYLKAAEYITQQRGHAVRMGAIVGEKLPDLKNPRIIDYATKYRTDFGDIYLSAKCKFFLCSTAGLFLVSTIFDVSVAHANLIPLKYPLFRKGDLFIPKKIWSVKKKRLLTFNEIINSEIIDYYRSELYDKAKLRVIENTPEEILDLAKEISERLDGKWKTTKEDEELQKRFKSLFKPGSHGYGFPSRIGAKFLRENKELLK